MDCQKIGQLINQLRREKNMTQKQLADQLNISTQAISKWERGLGCPDVSLLNELSEILNINVNKILQGDLYENKQGGSMKRIRFYVCKKCGNIVTSLQESDIYCCGRKLAALKVNNKNQEHDYLKEESDNHHILTFNHQMTKEHYLSFIAYVKYDRVLLIHLYPEQDSVVRLPIFYRGQVYVHCTKHGLIKL